ncbi:MAG TPA: adenylate/guanylate cyclase domain-containing protein [Casimicrobiaceae bacterium]
MAVSRKLAAVVFADVAGYSRLMEHDEAGTHARLREIREKLVDPKIAEHGGRTVHTSGDGMLLEFPSATSALRCAVEIQREMGVRNLYVAPDERIEFRIGINLGDIIVEGDDIIGDGVNVAQRLETLAEPGGICVASAVWEQVHEDLGVEFVDSGEQHVKNISKPIRVFRVALGKGSAAKAPAARPPPAEAANRFNGRRIAVIGGAIAVLAVIGVGISQWLQRQGVAGSAAVAGPPPRSIMVLPFGAPPNDATLGTLTNSLSGDVTRALANSLRDARIAAASGAAVEKGKPIDERALGREANVRYLLAGDVRGSAEDIVVNARLTDTATGKELGSERRTIARARAVEDHDLLVARVTAASRLMFQNAEGRRIAALPLDTNDAQSLVARADTTFTEEDIATTRAARKLYEQARERDPTLVSAWIGHMYTLWSEHWYDFAVGRNEALLAEVDRDSRRAVALDDRDADAWNARKNALISQWKWQAAFEAFDRAAALDPSSFRAPVSLLILTGRSAEALQAIAKRNAMLGAPDPGLLFSACHAHIHLGHYKEGIEQCERAVADGNDYWIYLDLTAAYAQTGDTARAAAAKAQLMKRVPDFTISRLEAKKFSNHPVWIEEIRTHFIAGLRKAGVPE